MTDPWLAKGKVDNNSANGQSTDNSKAFEDNFEPGSHKGLDDPVTKAQNLHNNCNEHKPLPDSATYLQGLERKLEKLKKGTKLVEALAEKRQDCLRTLLNEEIDGIQNNNVELVELETPVNSSESAVHEIYRHLQPVQPVTVGETVHIVKYDQLEEIRQTSESAAEEDTPDK